MVLHDFRGNALLELTHRQLDAVDILARFFLHALFLFRRQVDANYLPVLLGAHLALSGGSEREGALPLINRNHGIAVRRFSRQNLCIHRESIVSNLSTIVNCGYVHRDFKEDG